MRKYLFYAFCFILLFSGCQSSKRENISEVLSLKEMSELATSQYVVSKIIKASDDQTWYKPGNRKIIMTCKATLTAGIDLSKLTKENISFDENSVTVKLPRAHLISLDIKPDNVRTAYEDISMFRSKFSTQEKNMLAADAEKQIRASVDSLGILTTAETNATLFISNYLKLRGFETVNINFENTGTDLN